MHNPVYLHNLFSTNEYIFYQFAKVFRVMSGA